MYEKEYDRIFVPFTTRMSSLEQLFYESLIEEVEKYLLITREWLQTTDGLEYLHTTHKSPKNTLKALLKNHKIDTTNLNNLLLTQYSIGSSYAHKSISKDFTSLKNSDKKSIKKLLGGVEKIIRRFDKTIRNDITSFIQQCRGQNLEETLKRLEGWIHLNITTPISAKVRSEMIARTEMNRSFTNGVLQTYSNYGLNSFDIINYNDVGVCETCISIIKDNPYTLEEVMRMLPVHPHCRCLCVIRHTTTEIPLDIIDNPKIIDMFLT